MPKKSTTVAVMAVVAAALSIPAMASANWTHSTVPIQQEIAVSFSGTFGYAGSPGAISCEVSPSEAVLTPGTTGEINSFNPKNCKGMGGLAGCTVMTINGTNFPWTLHTNTEDIQVTGLHVDTTFSGAFCPYHLLELKGNLTLTPNDKHAAKELSLSTAAAGDLEWFNGTTGATVATITLSGTWALTPASTYGVT